jgi:hypothetical protein
MIIRLTFVVVLLVSFVPALAAVTQPSPAPSVTAEPALKEIGRIHATTPLCRTLATRATLAANIAIDEDRKIAFTVGTLRTIKLDQNVIFKTRSTDQLRRQFVAWRAAAVEGEAEMRRFREDAKQVTDPEQKKALVLFADALAGVLFRQKKLADDLGRYIAWLDAQESLTDQPDASTGSTPSAVSANSRSGIEKSIAMNQSNQNMVHNPWGDNNNVPETLDKSARRAADELVIRTVPIAKDEDDAASRIDPAFKGC